MPEDIQGRHVDLNGRVYILEQGFHQLSSDVKSGFTELSSKFGNLAERFSSNGKTDWKLICSAMAVVITLVGGFITITKAPIEERLAIHSADLITLKTEVATISSDLNKNYMRTEDWRYERDRNFGMLTETNKEQNRFLEKLNDKLARDEAELARVQADGGHK